MRRIKTVGLYHLLLISLHPFVTFLGLKFSYFKSCFLYFNFETDLWKQLAAVSEHVFDKKFLQNLSSILFFLLFIYCHGYNYQFLSFYFFLVSIQILHKVLLYPVYCGKNTFTILKVQY